jgi:hypothetical protein
LPLLKISDFDRSTKLLYDKPRPQAGWTAKTLLDRIKIEANKRDMPYQSLIKAWLVEDVKGSRRPLDK